MLKKYVNFVKFGKASSLEKIDHNIRVKAPHNDIFILLQICPVTRTPRMVFITMLNPQNLEQVESVWYHPSRR